jgi:hypothetical protein
MTGPVSAAALSGEVQQAAIAHRSRGKVLLQIPPLGRQWT